MNWWVTLTADGTAITPGSGLFAAQQNASQVLLPDTDSRLVAFQLPTVKQAACAAIDAKTQALLAAGFAYTPSGQSQSYQFGLDQASCVDWTGMMIGAAGLTYPFSIHTVANEPAQLASAADVQGFYAAGLARAAAIKQGGLALKQQVLAATSAAAVAAITDTRS
jgi:hypothetical protein